MSQSLRRGAMGAFPAEDPSPDQIPSMLRQIASHVEEIRAVLFEVRDRQRRFAPRPIDSRERPMGLEDRQIALEDAMAAMRVEQGKMKGRLPLLPTWWQAVIGMAAIHASALAMAKSLYH